jgi:hypothetical protein
VSAVGKAGTGRQNFFDRAAQRRPSSCPVMSNAIDEQAL